MELGISIYFSYELEDIVSELKKAKDNGFKYAFTSLHIPEEDTSKYIDKINCFINTCKELQLFPIVDVSPRALSMLKVKEFKDLKKLGIEHLRLDFGFSYDEIKELSKEFKLLFNASTLNEETYYELLKRDVNFNNVYGSHNFYPKKYTGLTEEKVKDINNRIHSYGMKTMGFVCGDKIKRGPLFEGLPTVENQRNDDVLYNALVLFKKLDCDIVIIGDFGLKDDSYRKLNNILNGFVEIDCKIDDKYSFFTKYIHHDRFDNSEFFIRSSESIYKYKVDYQIDAFNTVDRMPGDICISNYKYLRYNGELEIMKKDLPSDERVNVVGKVDTKYLEFIDDHLGVKLINK